MQNQISKIEDFSIIEKVVIQGDLSSLSPEQRVMYYKKVCESAGLNPLTNPFSYISLNGKLTLYAKKDCTEQLRKVNGVSIESLDYKIVEDLYIVSVKARDKTGRTDASTGAIVIGNLKGEARANAIMKAETKAKRRVTLSLCGLGWVDESEVESIPNAQTINVDLKTGEIIQTFEEDRLSSDEINSLNSLLENLKTRHVKSSEGFFAQIEKHYKVNCVQDLPKSSYERCFNNLTARIKLVKDQERAIA